MLDLVIKNGKVVDGSGLPAFKADVGIKDGVIVRIGPITEEAIETIDADGQVVAPGLSIPIPTSTHSCSGTERQSLRSNMALRPLSRAIAPIPCPTQSRTPRSW